MGKKLKDPSIEYRHNFRTMITKDSKEKLYTIAVEWNWSLKETHEYLLRFAIEAHTRGREWKK